MITKSALSSYFDALGALLVKTEAADREGPLALEAALGSIIARTRRAHARGNKVMFIGNGGSAGIASHMATDWSKNGGVRAIACNDPVALTCFANDYGYEEVFAKQIELHSRAGDILVAISSSGRSRSILFACEAARRREMEIVTLSGFAADNPLRNLGDINLYVGAGEYGAVEVTHLVLCHTIVDFMMRIPADV